MLKNEATSYTYTCPKCGGISSGLIGPGGKDACLWCGEVITVPEEARKSTYKPHLPMIREVGEKRLATPTEVERALAFIREVGARPELGEIYLYFGKPWLAIQYWYRAFRETYPRGRTVTQALDLNERKRTQLPDDVQAWKATCFNNEGVEISVGYGYARQGEAGPLAHGSAVEPQWPWRLAEKRAEEDAIRKAVPLGLSPEEHRQPVMGYPSVGPTDPRD